MRNALVCLAVALALPTSVAFAKSPHSNPGTHGKSAPKVLYILKGTLSAYTPAGSTDGQISITVNHSNYHGRALKGQLLTFTVTTKTRITFRNGTTADQIDGAKGIVTVRAPKRVAPADLATTLQTYSARHVIVQKAAS
jgi:hypothetical protein